MAVSLSKGQRISLAKSSGASLSKVRMGLGWDPAQPQQAGGFFAKLFGGGAAQEIDLDASCLLLDTNKNLLDVVWFRQLQSRDGSISHSGDNRTGEGDGDDETIFVDLTRLPANVAHLAFTVCSFRGQTFNEVDGAFCRLVDDTNDAELAKFDLSDKGAHTGVVMAIVSRDSGGWQMKAVGTPTAGAVANDMMPAVMAAI